MAIPAARRPSSSRLPTCLAALVLLALPIGASRAATVDSIADPRPGSQVIDLQGVLGVQGLQSIDGHASRGSAGGELLVVVADTTSGRDPRSFATALFNRLGLDSKERNRGVLLFAALSDRKAEIVVGDGFPDGFSRTTDRIMSDVVIANFRRGDPKAAMVEGARALVDDLLLAADAPAPSELPAGEFPIGASAGDEAVRVDPYGNDVGSSGTLAQRAEEFADSNPGAVCGGGWATLLGLFLGVRKLLRDRPRSCSHCGQKMVRLGEKEDDAHLSAAEKTEERIGSVDYDIWMCPACQLALKLRYGAFFTSYSKCSACGTKALKTTSTTLVAATEHSTGTARVDERCAHCQHHRSFTRTIPRRPKPSSSSSSRSSFSSSRSSSSSSSRGSSSGRGSSGGW